MLDYLQAYPSVSAAPRFQTQRALVTLHRRESDLHAAESLALQAIEDCRRAFGDSSTQKEQAMMELVYVYTYQREFDKGLEVCRDALRHMRMRQGASFPDSRTSYAMENMAELHQFRGEDAMVIYWLDRALTSAWKHRGGVATTVHVREKLEGALIATGRLEEGLELKHRYPGVAEIVVEDEALA